MLIADCAVEGVANFIPFFNNANKGCIVGRDTHAEYSDPAGALCEVYFNPDFGVLTLVHVEDLW